MTAWDVCPRSWAAAAGMEARRCAVELPFYLSDGIRWLPMVQEADAMPRSRPSPRPRQAGDGRLRFRMEWSIEVEAARWRRARRLGVGYAALPVHPSLRLDVALHFAAELYGLPVVAETDAVMRVLRPCPAAFTPEGHRLARGITAGGGRFW
ncbi:hypothetical protein [Thermomonospora cellulosilytica]|uniref:Uncharacterized protein n=1 Tax=Thermomonospora cellulosilytica TaxID=1411118 RepID=A0A7W3RAH8_9ACTN|nr:hypothetical protein [Thermomonospora cellulosilytica]MBA9005882.1 hypothetical protein [Thermomonospora cellulosilytica]